MSALKDELLSLLKVWGVDFERLSAGVLALILNSGAYQCEIVRSCIQSIHKGQLEAAMSLGFSKL